MLSLATELKIFVFTPAADMRNGVNGLSGIVRSQFQADPTDGSLYLFINRRRDRLKILHFDGGGFWLYYRVLESGTFEALTTPPENDCQLQIDATQLSMLLSGVSLVASRRRRKRYSKARPEKQSAHAA
jgi:transposase